MPNCLLYGSNRLFLFWMLAKLGKSADQTNAIVAQKTVENYVDKIVVTATTNFRKPTMTTFALECVQELYSRTQVQIPHKMVEADYSQSYPQI